MRIKIADLSMALEGRFGDHHALMCRLRLDHMDHLEAMIARPEAQIEAMMTPFRAARDLTATASGIGPLSAPAGSPRSAPTSATTSPTLPAWPPGPGYTQVATTQSAGGAQAGGARATSTCNPSWWSAPGQRSATTATSKPLPPTTGTS
jgi:transposase